MFFIIIISVFSVVAVLFMQAMTPKDKLKQQRRAQAKAEIAAATRPAELPSLDATMSPHLDLGSWRQWDGVVSVARICGSNPRKAMLWFISCSSLPIMASFFIRLGLNPYVSAVLFTLSLLSFGFLALRVFGRCSSKQNFFEKVVIKEGLICPACEVGLEASAAPGQWACPECASNYTGERLTRLIRDRFKKWFGFQQGIPLTDRISFFHMSQRMVFIWTSFAVFMILLPQLLEWNHWYAALVLLLMFMSGLVIVRAIRLRFDPYSRCGCCFHAVPENAALPERCSECGCSWHAPGGLLHHRIEWRPFGYGGLAVLLLGVLLTGNAMYRNWQLGQALQAPTTASTSVLMAGLAQDSSYQLDEVVLAELHQRKLTSAETNALAEIYLSQIELDRPLGDLGLPFLISAREAEQLNADTALRISQALPRLSLGDAYLDVLDTKYKTPPLTSQLAMYLLDAKATLGGGLQDPVFMIWRMSDGDVLEMCKLSSGSQRLDWSLRGYIEALDLQVGEERVYFQIDLDSLTPAVADAIPVLAFEQQKRDESVEPYFALAGTRAIQPRPLNASEVSEIQAAKAALGGGAGQDPVFKIRRSGMSTDRARPWAYAELSSGSLELDRLLGLYIEAADISVDGKEPLYVQIDLDSLNPAVAEVTP